jgi:tripartite ATP-independent transporter DctP family solute receptor
MSIHDSSSTRRSFFGAVAATALAASATTRVARAAPLALKHGHHLPATHPLHLRSVEMWAAVKRDTNGAVDVTVFPNQQLGSSPQMLAQLRSGAIDFLTASGGTLSAVVPLAGIETVGFAFRNDNEAFAAMEGDLGAYVRSELALRKLHSLQHLWTNGFENISTTSKRITSPGDLVGLKLRTAVGPMWFDVTKSLGAAPTPIGQPELYTALQTKVVDGQEGTIIDFGFNHLSEVQKHLAVTNTIWIGWFLSANADLWQSFSPDIAAAIERNNQKYARLFRLDTAGEERNSLAAARSAGVEISSVANSLFRARLGPFYARWKETFGVKAWNMLEGHVGRLA